jgi:hypothetical protein
MKKAIEAKNFKNAIKAINLYAIYARQHSKANDQHCCELDRVYYCCLFFGGEYHGKSREI